MGVLQRFERRLEGMIEAIVAQGRTLVPNDFVVELSASDRERLAVYADNLGQELSKLAREYATEQGYSFVGPVRVRFETADDLQTGRFRVRSAVIRGDTVKDGEIIKPVTDHPRRGSVIPGRPRLLLSPGGAAADGSLTAQGAQQAYELTSEVTLLGRGTDCDLRLVDNGVSRHHAEIRLEGNEAILVDLNSTNGTFVNGQQVQRARLVDGSRISLGRTTMTFRRD